MNFLLGQGAIAGMVAGALFAAVQMILARAAGEPLLAPWRMAASVVLGESAVTGALPFWMFLVGFVTHFILAALIGMGFAAVASILPATTRKSWAAHAGVGALLGVATWFINFQVIARLAYPWFLTGTNAWVQLALHALAFGVPVGIYLTSTLRRQVGWEQRARRPAPHLP
jgi:hypothetical protein